MKKLYLLILMLVAFASPAAIFKSAYNSKVRSNGAYDYLDWATSRALVSGDSLVLTKDSSGETYFDTYELTRSLNLAPDSLRTCVWAKKTVAGTCSLTVVRFVQPSLNGTIWTTQGTKAFALTTTYAPYCSEAVFEPRVYLRNVLLTSDSATVLRAWSEAVRR